MKKILLIFTLLFAMGMQANAVKGKQNTNQITQTVALEMPDYMVKWDCTTETKTTVFYNEDGSMDIITYTYTHCERIE